MPDLTPAAGARFLAGLPERFRPDRDTIDRLASKVDLLLAAGWSEEDLRRRLTAGADSDYSPVVAVVRRLERFPLPKGTPAPERPAWCGECDEHTRQRENDQGLPYRCPRCNPRAVSA